MSINVMQFKMHEFIHFLKVHGQFLIIPVLLKYLTFHNMVLNKIYRKKTTKGQVYTIYDRYNLQGLLYR